MSPLDPQNAPFRCWDHEDCLEHPELALACAGGERTALAMFGPVVHPDDLGGERRWAGASTAGRTCSGDGDGDGDDPLGTGSYGTTFPISLDLAHWECWVPTVDGDDMPVGVLLETLTDYERVLWYHFMLRVP